VITHCDIGELIFAANIRGKNEEDFYHVYRPCCTDGGSLG
jgi:hypothetical protein